jgi:anti-sigma B factor antagonist
MDLSMTMQGDMMVVSAMTDRIDAASAIQFKDQMRTVLQAPAARVVLDLTQVNFLDSSGLGAVVAVMKLLGPGRKLELAGLTPTVQKVFRLTRMDSVFVIHPAVPEGLRDAG